MIDVRLGIFGHTFLKEISFPLKRNHIHEIEWVCGIVVFLVTKR